MTHDTDREPFRHTGYLIRRAQQRHVALWTRLVSAETTSVQYSVLAVLDDAGEASQRDLCDAIDLDRSTIADLVSRMERRGLVARRRDPADARRNTVTLTAEGAAEFRRLVPLAAAANAALTSALAEEDHAALRRGLRGLLRDGDGEDVA